MFYSISLLKDQEIVHWIDMVLLPLRGNFADYEFHKAQCLIWVFLKDVRPLTSVA